MKYPYTKVPNWYFDLLPSLSECESRVLQVVMRKTYGWNRTSDKISISQFMELSGLKTRASVVKGLKGLAQRGIVQKSPKTITAQQVTIIPIESTISASLVVHLVDSESIVNEPLVVHLVDSQKTESNTTFKDNNMAQAPALDSAQAQAVLLLVEYGFDSEDSALLVGKAWANNRDISYIQDLWGYVCQHSKQNPLGYFRNMLERNKVTEVTSKAYEKAPAALKAIKAYHYYDAGLEELERHDGPIDVCEICTAQAGEETVTK